MLIHPEPCAVCGRLFTPRRTGANRLSRTCGRASCRLRLATRHPHYQATRQQAGRAGSRTRHAETVAKMVAQLSADFGPLTVREQEIAVAAKYGDFTQAGKTPQTSLSRFGR